MKFYPTGRENILEFYKDEYESCFILFHPFVCIDEEVFYRGNRTNSYKTNIIPSVLSDIFKKIKLNPQIGMYAVNTNYPNKKEVIERGRAICWKELIKNSEILNTYTDIQKALKTSIGAYAKVFHRNDLKYELEEVLKKMRIWSPQEDVINPLTKRNIYQIFELLNVDKFIDDDFSMEKNTIDFNTITENEFCLETKSCYIYSLNKEVMIAQSRDTFYCLLLTKNKKSMTHILDNIELEGILCDRTTSLPWEFGKQEFDEILESSKG